MNSVFLTEQPWVNLDCVACPYCGTNAPPTLDYKVEDFYIPLHFKDYFKGQTDQSIKRKYLSRLFVSRLIPVLCHNIKCPGQVFIYDRKKQIAFARFPQRHIAEILIKNRDKIYHPGVIYDRL